MDDPKRIVAAGYDSIAETYRDWAEADAWPRLEWLALLEAELPDGSAVLELGCGAGIDAIELAEGRRYTGVDLSETMISLARGRVPSGTFVRGDLASVAFPQAAFDAVVSLYVFGHVPASEHVPTFRRVFEWLRPGGAFCASVPSGAHDGIDRIAPDGSRHVVEA